MKNLLKPLILLFSFMTLGCVSTLPLQTVSETVNEEYETEFFLENGIPVFLQQDINAKVNTMEIYFSTGAANLTESQCGYQALLMELLAMENKNYSEDRITLIMDKYLSSLTYGSLSDSSFLCLTSLEKYFYNVFPVLESAVTNPSFKSYEKTLKKVRYNFANTKYIDNNLLMKLSGAVLREQTGYFGKNSFSKDSINNCTKAEIKNLYENLLRKNSIYILCSGNFDEKLLLEKLNAQIGKLKLKDENEEKEFNITFYKTRTELAVNEKNAVDFAISYTKLPLPTEELFAPCYVASLMYSDILYQIVREKCGSCYSTYASVNPAKYPIMITMGYRVSDKENFWKGIEEAQEIFYGGKIQSHNEKGEVILIDSGKKLESYKNSLINRLYGDVNTSKDRVQMMAMGLNLADQVDFMNKFVDSINSINEEQLKAAIQYLQNQNEQWFYLTSK